MPEGELDILITRVIDGRASQDDWRRLEILSAADPGVWRDLAQAQRDDAALRQAMMRVAGVASGVDLPVHEAREQAAVEITRDRSRRVAMWGGWLAAAAVTLAFVSQRPVGTGPNTGGTQAAGAPLLSAADAFNRYLEEGRKEGSVIEELPEKVLVNTAPAPDGQGYNVVYLRLIMERAQVPDLYRFSSDEFGRAAPVRIRVTPRTESTNRPY